ncbi:hypothetical protein CR152_24280 [Massilia violaceinigra]|uniref:Uncharacterized protein n=1 Tax=Massilia violaceinigra TaxID=2045208 RepID=A0A2D2DQM7_9BURK|nr:MULTISPECIES: hypothetical protein [Massilia]ATQ77285.1 hypothetical protein CR152_24280 [Massilia violaceinigra]MDQ1922011.1 hypothetical protein [Massilia sp. CCM 9206]
MHEKIIGRRYLRELFGAIGIYALILTAAIVYGRTLAEGPARTLVLASPVIGVALAVWAIVRHMRRVDEFIRQSTLENLGIAAALTAALTLTYGFLETAGFPRLSMFTVWPLMGACWLVTGLVRGCAFK